MVRCLMIAIARSLDTPATLLTRSLLSLAFSFADFLMQRFLCFRAVFVSLPWITCPVHTQTGSAVGIIPSAGTTSVHFQGMVMLNLIMGRGRRRSVVRRKYKLFWRREQLRAMACNMVPRMLQMYQRSWGDCSRGQHDIRGWAVADAPFMAQNEGLVYGWRETVTRTESQDISGWWLSQKRFWGRWTHAANCLLCLKRVRLVLFVCGRDDGAVSRCRRKFNTDYVTFAFSRLAPNENFLFIRNVLILLDLSIIVVVISGSFNIFPSLGLLFEVFAFLASFIGRLGWLSGIRSDI